MSHTNQLPNLEKILRDDDDADFVPSGGSNLAAIFRTSQAPFDLSSITKANSQKKAVEQSISKTETESKAEVVVAKAVHAFKLQDRNYVSVGKLGIALVKKSSIKVYQILLYQSKQNIISVARITPDFSYTIQKNNYASYYDSNQLLWSIAFENKNACIEFAREVGVSKYFTRQDKPNDTVISQDLTYSNKIQKVKEGDQVSVRYAIAWDITQPLKITALPEQPKNVIISLENNWEKLLCGTCTMLRKILFLPPSRQISLGIGFPKEKDIALEVEIVDIITHNEEITLPDKVEVPQSVASSSKPSLLSRMAKMGHSILVKQHVSTTDSDTEEDIPQKSVSHKKLSSPDLLTRRKQVDTTCESSESSGKSNHKVGRLPNVHPSIHNSNNSMVQPVVSTQWSPTQTQIPYVPMERQLHSIPAMIDPNLNIFLSETRTQNTELRIGMSKIADNVQKILDKIHVFEMQNATSPSNNASMETTIKTLLALNANHVDSRVNLAQNNSIISHKVDNFESLKLEIKGLKEMIAAKDKELKNLTESLGDQINNFKEVENKMQELQRLNIELMESVRVQIPELSWNEDKAELKRMTEKIAEIEAINSKYRKENEKLQTEVQDLNNQLQRLHSSSVNVDIQEMVKEKNMDIKIIMSRTYYTLLGQFTNDTYTKDFIRDILSKTIKSITLEILKQKRCDSKEREGDKVEHMNSVKDANKKHANSETAGSSIDKQSGKTSLVADSTSVDKISVSSDYHDEPPPIPPIDTDIDSDWCL